MTLPFRDERTAFAEEFLQKLKLYCESGGADSLTYGWLIHRSPRMQRQMGSEGMYGLYRPPHQTYHLRNYPIILNMLPELRRALEDPVLSQSDLTGGYAIALQEALVRHLGILDDQHRQEESFLKNPLIWLREGVRVVVAIPVSLLAWSGLISQRTSARLATSFLFRAISAVVYLIGFLSSVMGIVLGWGRFVDLVSNLLK